MSIFPAVMSDEAAAQGEGPVEVELSAEEAAALYSLGAMLNAPSLAPEAGLDPPAPTLAELLAASGAPLALAGDAASGLRLVATRDIAAGEVLLEESALAWCLCRSPGSDARYWAIALSSLWLNGLTCALITALARPTSGLRSVP